MAKDKSAMQPGHEWTPPSQMLPPQYPAVKPGEPVPFEIADPLKREIKVKQVQPPETVVAKEHPNPQQGPMRSGSGPLDHKKGK